MDDDIDFTYLFHPEIQVLNQVDELSLSLPQTLNTLGGVNACPAPNQHIDKE